MTHLRGEGKLVRIFIGESDRLGGHQLYEAIVLAAREMGLGGATVLRGVAGYGARSVVHTSRLLRMSEDLPVVVEVVELAERIEPFVARVEAMLDEADCGGLITLERAEVIRYQPSAGRRG
jgi:PII-like signaling protein